MRSLLLAICLSLGSTSLAAELQAWLERDLITDAETVALFVTVSGERPDEPDLDALKADFDLVDVAHTSRAFAVDGAPATTHEWRLELAPRRTGWLTVPALTVGELTTEPLTLEVLDAGLALMTRADEPVFIDVIAAPMDPYVQGRVDYQVRLFTSVPLQEPRLTDPQGEGMTIRQIGDDRQSSEQIGADLYTVTERRYAIFPKQAGPLEIQPPRLNAAMPIERSSPDFNGLGGDPFAPLDEVMDEDAGPDGLFEATRQVRVSGRAITLGVRPPPDGADPRWLPAESVALRDEWTPKMPVIHIGQTMTRTLTITATGVLSEQLPELALEAPDGVALYPEAIEDEDRVEAGLPVAERRIRMALRVTEPGVLTLPEIRVAWWDTVADRPREARLEARSLEVIAGPGIGTGLGGLSQWFGAQGAWLWVAAAFAVTWLATLGLWWRGRRRPATLKAATLTAAIDDRPPEMTRGQRLAESRRAIERACRRRGPRDAREALLDWGRVAWPEDPPHGLLSLAARLESDEAAGLLAGLERGLYGEDPWDWDGEGAWVVLAPALEDPRS
ncbi:BatD family protein [Thioalkalicoccus limnaeus]|uniref:BatD family protein n=1 Tax=Thioalkalicoccus limnaeus TaxID=120681 RepID=A0ABV4BIK9_9GAMM